MHVIFLSENGSPNYYTADDYIVIFLIIHTLEMVNLLSFGV